MSAVEQLESRAGPTDLSKSERARTFLVDGLPDTALFDAQLQAQAPLGGVYPGGNSQVPFPLICDRYEVRRLGGTQFSLVDAIYSNDRRGRLNPAPDRTRPTYTTWEISYQKTQVDFPSILRYPLLVPGADVPAANTPTLDAKLHKISETLLVVHYSAVLQGLARPSIDLIHAQDNKIHKMPDNRIWLFSAGDIRQTEKSAWEVTYTWVRDTGTVTPGNYLNGPYQSFINLGNGRSLYSPGESLDLWVNIDPTVAIDPTASYVRSPFHVITYTIQGDMTPLFYQFMPYGYQPLGWQNLPGFNP